MSAKRGLGLRFQKKASRPPLTREQFLYWKDFLSKVLKVGTEFEIMANVELDKPPSITNQAQIRAIGDDIGFRIETGGVQPHTAHFQPSLLALVCQLSSRIIISCFAAPIVAFSCCRLPVRPRVGF